MKTYARPEAMVAEVQTERTDRQRLTERAQLAFQGGDALSEFVEAVLAFSDDPGANLVRYLEASRALEEPVPDGRVR